MVWVEVDPVSPVEERTLVPERGSVPLGFFILVSDSDCMPEPEEVEPLPCIEDPLLIEESRPIDDPLLNGVPLPLDEPLMPELL